MQFEWSNAAIDLRQLSKIAVPFAAHPWAPYFSNWSWGRLILVEYLPILSSILHFSIVVTTVLTIEFYRVRSLSSRRASSPKEVEWRKWNSSYKLSKRYISRALIYINVFYGRMDASTQSCVAAELPYLIFNFSELKKSVSIPLLTQSMPSGTTKLLVNSGNAPLPESNSAWRYPSRCQG